MTEGLSVARTHHPHRKPGGCRTAGARWTRIALLSLAVLAAGCGGGGGGGGGGSAPPPAPQDQASQDQASQDQAAQDQASQDETDRLLVSGTVRNLSAPGAARVARADLPAIGDAVVRVSADLDGDGVFDPDTETFTTRTDDGGGFVLRLPAGAVGKALELRVQKPGYSSFVQRYDGVEGPVLVDPVLSQGAVAAVDLGGISATPSRAGRVVLDTDRVVTVSLVRDRATGRRAARVFWGSPSPDGSRDELARMSFSLRGLELPADTERLYAGVAYLDTVNDPDTMPGGFQAEGSGESPVDVLTTYAASEITLQDELGNELLTDPTDHSREIRIRIAIPAEAYETLIDENPETPEVEIPLFYYDEAAGIWRLHRDAEGNPALGHLEDAYGNALTRDDLARIVAGEEDAQVFGVGTVNHFTTWNLDKSWTSVSYHARLRDRSGNPADGVAVRVRTRRGGRSSDKSRRANANLHTYRANADSIIKRIMDRSITAEERSRYLYAVLNSKNPDALTALVDALRRYAASSKADIASDENEFRRGLRAIFRNKEINDAVIDTTSLDCSKTPDLCKGAIAAAAENVNRASKAKQVTAFLMQIAVDAYNPTNMDFEYVATKGLEFLDIVVNTKGVAKKLGEIPGQVRSARDLASKALEAYRAYKNGTGTWRSFWDLAKQLRETMENVKSLATTLGSRLNRQALRAAPLPEPDPQTPEEEAAAVDQIKEEVLASYDELGGLLFGYSRMRRYKWGYFDDEGEFHEVEDWPGKPDYVGSGTAVTLEYYDGTDWVPLEGRSDLGVDASFITVPTVTSFGPGSPQAPAVYLGTWTLNLEPNVEVTGRIESTGGDPLADVTVVVAGTELRTGADGVLSGKIRWFSDSTFVPYRIPAFWNAGRATLSGGTVDLGTVQVQDRVTIDGAEVPWSSRVRRGEALTVEPGRWAGTVSGRALSYTYELFEGWSRDESVPLERATGDTYTFTPGPDTPFGRYTLRVTAQVPGDDSVQPVRVSLGIQVVSTPPVIDEVRMDASQVPAGTPVHVTVVAEDADGADDIRSTSLRARCQDEAGKLYWVVPNREPDGTWTLTTDSVYALLDGSVTCEVTASVTDRSGLVDQRTERLTIEANPVPPEVRSGGLDDAYTVSLWRRYNTETEGWEDVVDVGFGSRVRFQDPNGDLDHFELDCGNGEEPLTADTPWTLPACRYTEPGDYEVTYRAVDSLGLKTELRTTVHVLYPLRIDVRLPEGTPTVEGDDGLQVELPPGDNASLDVTVSVLSDNCSGGYCDGKGTIEQGNYSVTYRSGNLWWWSETLASNQPLPADHAIPLTLDRPGSYTVSVWAQDDQGMSAWFSRVIEVTAPFDGELYVNGQGLDAFRKAGGWVLVGQEVAFSVEDVTAPDGADMRYRWLVNGEDRGEGTATTFAFAPDAEGEYTVRVEMRNAQETTDAHRVVREVTFPAYTPAAVGLERTDAVGGTAARVGDLVELRASVPQGTEVTRVRWEVSGPDGGYRPVPTNDPLAAAWTFASAGEYTVTVQVEDGRGVVSTATFGPFEVTADPPQVSLTASALSGRPPLAVSFQADASDPDLREGEVLRYRWFVDGEPVAAGTEATYAHTFDTEGSHTVRVEVTDAGGLTATDSVTVAVRDLPPTIASVRVQPGSGVAPLEVTATAEATDDGTVAGYAWYVDGEAVGTGATLTHTFQTPGTHTLKVVVTDDAGQTSSRDATVYVLDPNEAGIAFVFKEVRSDGLGPEVDFAALEEELSHGGGMWFASTPLTDASVDAGDLVDLAPSLSFAGPALYGFHAESWGNVYDTLIQVETPGTYEVGLSSWSGGAEREVRFPGSYTCGVVLYDEGARTFGFWSEQTLSSLAINPSWSYTTTDGRVNLLAMLGTRNAETSTCDYAYFGFTSSAENTLSLTDADAVVWLASLEVTSPADLDVQLSDVGIVLDGMELWFGGIYHLPRDAQDRVQVPVVPGADYILKFGVSLGDAYWTVLVPLDGGTVGASDPVAVDLTGLNPESPLGLENAPAGYLMAEIVATSGTRLQLAQNVSEAATATGSVLTVADESTVSLWFDGTDGQRNGFGFYRAWAPDTLPDPLDLANPGLAVSVTEPQIAVDTEAKTVTVAYQPTGADACVVAVEVGLDTDDDGQADRTRSETVLADGSTTEVAFSYPLPETSISFGEGDSTFTETYPAADAVTQVAAKVTCMKLTGGYDAFVMELLRRGGPLQDIVSRGWPPVDLKAFGAVEEMAWKQTSWTPGP